jgi:hypothetical protein
MRRRTVAACVSAIGAVGAIAVGTTVAGAATGARTEHIRFLLTDPTSNSPVAVANGPIHALGRDVTVDAHHDKIIFPDGNLLISHHRVAHHASFDKTTCYGRQTESGTYTVTGGTGKYAHASGSGVYHFVGQFVGCSQHKPPKVFELEIDAHGPLSL